MVSLVNLVQVLEQGLKCFVYGMATVLELDKEIGAKGRGTELSKLGECALYGMVVIAII
jgi:hypothetical protein